MLKVACFAAHEAGGANAVLAAERERQQQQRPALAVVGDHDKGLETVALSDQPLPVPEEIKALIRRGELRFEAAPDRLGLAEIVDDVDAGDAARWRPRLCPRRSAFDRGSHGHCETCP